jgi:hypothetical protein
VLVDRHALGEVLALEDPDVEQLVKDQVVDLGGAPVELDPQVVDRRTLGTLAVLELDLVGRAPTWSDATHAIEVASIVAADVARALVTAISQAAPGGPRP